MLRPVLMHSEPGGFARVEHSWWILVVRRDSPLVMAESVYGTRKALLATGPARQRIRRRHLSVWETGEWGPRAASQRVWSWSDPSVKHARENGWPATVRWRLTNGTDCQRPGVLRGTLCAAESRAPRVGENRGGAAPWAEQIGGPSGVWAGLRRIWPSDFSFSFLLFPILNFFSYSCFISIFKLQIQIQCFI
jgi:hypothetical protein